MPFVARRIIQLALVLCISIMFAAAALAAGPYAVGTSCIQIDTGKIASGRSLNDYLQGNWDGDQRFYVDQILASPESTFF